MEWGVLPNTSGCAPSPAVLLLLSRERFRLKSFWGQEVHASVFRHDDRYARFSPLALALDITKCGVETCATPGFPGCVVGLAIENDCHCSAEPGRIEHQSPIHGRQALRVLGCQA